MKLNREQIEKAIKTLEGAKVMVANRDFKEFQMAVITAINALSLIRELTVENERLRAEAENQSVLWKRHFESIFETAKEIVKADTVRRMQEMFKEKVAKILIGSSIQYQANHFIDQIAKELLEGNQ